MTPLIRRRTLILRPTQTPRGPVVQWTVRRTPEDDGSKLPARTRRIRSLRADDPDTDLEQLTALALYCNLAQLDVGRTMWPRYVILAPQPARSRIKAIAKSIAKQPAPWAEALPPDASPLVLDLLRHALHSSKTLPPTDEQLSTLLPAPPELTTLTRKQYAAIPKLSSCLQEFHSCNQGALWLADGSFLPDTGTANASFLRVRRTYDVPTSAPYVVNFPPTVDTSYEAEFLGVLAAHIVALTNGDPAPEIATDLMDAAAMLNNPDKRLPKRLSPLARQLYDPIPAGTLNVRHVPRAEVDRADRVNGRTAGWRHWAIPIDVPDLIRLSQNLPRPSPSTNPPAAKDTQS